MFGFLTSVGNEATDPLTDSTTVESFWRKLPRNDPVAAQTAVCEALAGPVARSDLTADRLCALLALDQRAHALVEALLAADTASEAEASSNEALPWQSAFELCWAFGRAYGVFLRSACDGRASQDWRKYEPQLLLSLFRHRRLELLLRPFIDERSTLFGWKDLHAAYRFAQSRGLLHDGLPIRRRGSALAAETTLEREYILVLMQDLVNGGHFPPRDALWIAERVQWWCGDAALEPAESQGARHGFVVDPHGDAGLARPEREPADTSLRFDIESVLRSIREEIATLRDAPDRPSERASPGRARKLALLSKLETLCAPERPIIARRGAREPTAASVEVVVGISRIVRMLRRSADEVGAGPPRSATNGDDVTITEFGGTTEGSTSGYDASTVNQSSTGGAGTAPGLLTMADRSDSGCRLHGPALASTRTSPGVLIAFREDAASPWTLAIARRVRKRLAGKRIEIGAEYLGKAPRLVVVSPVHRREDEQDLGRQPSAIRRTLPVGERRASGAADEDVDPSGARDLARRSPFRALAHVDSHDSAQGAARRAGRFHLVAVRDPRAPAEGRSSDERSGGYLVNDVSASLRPGTLAAPSGHLKRCAFRIVADRFRAAPKTPAQEVFRDRVERDPVLGTGEAVPFVGVDHIGDRDLARIHRVDDLVGFLASRADRSRPARSAAAA